MVYYYGYDATMYGPARKTEMHESKNLTIAMKNAYRMVRSGWESVCITNERTYKEKSVTRIVSFDEIIKKMIVVIVNPKSLSKYVLKSDGSLGKKVW